MKKLVSWCLVVAVMACLQSGCRETKPTLHVCGPKDFIKPEQIARFEKDNNSIIVYTSVESNEDALDQIKAGRQDVVIVPGSLIPGLKEQGVLVSFNRKEMPNLKNLDPLYLRYTPDPNAEISAPVSVTFLGIAYEDNAFEGDFESSWNMLSRMAPNSRLLLPENTRITQGIALRALGFSANTPSVRERDAARAVMESYMTAGAKTGSGLINGYLRKNLPVAAPVSNREYLRLREEYSTLKFSVPWNGTMLFFQSAVILRDSDSLELAQAFINFLQDPEVAAENTTYAHALCPNKASYRYLPHTLQSDPVMILPGNILAGSEPLK